MLSKILVIFALLSHSLVILADECLPTAHRTTGTHYEPVTQHKQDISKGIIVKGTVLAMPDCQPVAHAKVSHWQAGEDGHYQDRLRAYLFTDEQGNYQFETEWPNITPPHIHFIIDAEGFQTLETQWIGSDRSEVITFDMVLEK